MENSQNLYEILGLESGASREDIKKAHRKLIKVNHPDKGGDAEKFKAIQHAYEILSDETKRRKYDNGGSQGFDGFDFDDIRSHFHSMFTKPNRRGTNISIIVALTLEEIKTGARKKVSYKKGIVCSICQGNGSKFGKSITNCSVCLGSGKVHQQFGPIVHVVICSHCQGVGKFITEKCNECGGAGMSEQDMNLDLEIPKGAFAGWKSRLANLGNDSAYSGSGPGDLVITIDEIPHKDFERHGNDIAYRLDLSMPDMILGVKVEIPTLEGTHITFEVPENTHIGKVFKINGRGLPDMRDGSIGNIMAVAMIEVPSKVTEEEKKILEKLRKNCNFVSKNTYKGK